MSQIENSAPVWKIRQLRYRSNALSHRSVTAARHDQRRELHSRRLKARLLISIAAATALFRGVDYAASADAPVADSSALNFKQWGLLAVQDGGRRKPVDTFAKETLIRIT